MWANQKPLTGIYIQALFSIFEELVLARGETFLKGNTSPRLILDQHLSMCLKKVQPEYHSLNLNRNRE